MALHIVTYDIELAVSPKKADEAGPGDITWDDAKKGKAGVTAVCVWDSLVGRPFLYDAHSIADCIEHLNEADLCIGWNSVEFDHPALEGYTKRSIHTAQLDIRQYVIAAIGDKYAKGYKLGEVCGRTLGTYKSGAGIGAPSLARDGRFAELFDYNINDVWLTKCLHNHIVQNGFVIRPDGKRLQIKKYPTKELA